MQKLITFIFLSLFILSCGAGQKSKLKLKVSNVATGGITMPGGIILYGHNNTSSEDISINMASGQEDIVLNNGDWDFFAVGWTGPENMEGSAKCGGANQILDGSDSSVYITITTANCNGPSGVSSKFISAGQFLNLSLWSCAAIPSSPTASTTCSSSVGNIGSFKISLIPEFEGVLDIPLSSKCYNVNSGTASTALSLPFLGSFYDVFFKSSVFAFAKAYFSKYTRTAGKNKLSPI